MVPLPVLRARKSAAKLHQRPSIDASASRELRGRAIQADTTEKLGRGVRPDRMGKGKKGSARVSPMKGYLGPRSTGAKPMLETRHGRLSFTVRIGRGD